jgi:hypothetical protein
MIAEEGKAGRKVGETWAAAKMVPSPAASNSHSHYLMIKVKASEGCEIGRGASNIAGERSICLVARYEHAPSIRLKLSAPAKGQFARDLGRRSAGVQPTLCRSRDVLAKLDHPALRMP